MLPFRWTPARVCLSRLDNTENRKRRPPVENTTNAIGDRLYISLALKEYHYHYNETSVKLIL